MIKRFFRGMGVFIIPGMVVTEKVFSHRTLQVMTELHVAHESFVYWMHLVTEPKT